MAWMPEDFLGIGNRTERQRIATKERLEVAMANKNLARMRKDQPPEDLPDLFTAPYRGTSNPTGEKPILPILLTEGKN